MVIRLWNKLIHRPHHLFHHLFSKLLVRFDDKNKLGQFVYSIIQLICWWLLIIALSVHHWPVEQTTCSHRLLSLGSNVPFECSLEIL